MTELGLADIKATLGRFEAARRAARDIGDREAVAAASRKFVIGRRGSRPRKLSNSLPTNSKASFGRTVTLGRDDGREQTFRIVGEDEANPPRYLPRIEVLRLIEMIETRPKAVRKLEIAPKKRNRSSFRSRSRTIAPQSNYAGLGPNVRGAQALRIDFPTERNQSPRLERDIQVIDDACRRELDVCRAAMPFHRAFDHH